LVINIMGAADELKFAYVERDTITPRDLQMYLDMENYGTAASLARSIRAGAEVEKEDADYYYLGEYAEVLFLKALFEESGNTASVNACEKRMKEIEENMPEYSGILEKIRWSVDQALGE
ncbi:MAG: hypothetical protein J6T47_07455, partial [Lachnospiraceae bacterium]|nr:hypothetical protein [Lachnospiraceae bacterium]